MSKPVPASTDFFKEFKKLQTRVATLERTTRLNNSSIDRGSIQIVNPNTGQVLSSVGITDGYHGIVTYDGAGNITEAIANDGTPPNKPSAPVVAPIPGGFSVTWDGKDVDGNPMPPDWLITEIHVGTVANFTTDVTTIHSTYTTSNGGTRNLLIGDTIPRYVKFRAIDRGRNTSTASDEVSVTPDAVLVDIGSALIDGAQLLDNSVPGPKIINTSITTEKLTVGSFGATVVPNGSFEDRKQSDATKAARWVDGHAAQGSGGSAVIESATANVNSGVNSMKITLASTASAYDITSDPFIVSPTTLFYVAAAVKGDGVAGHNVIVRVYFGSSPTFDTGDAGVTFTDVVVGTNPLNSFNVYEGQFISGAAQTYARLSVVNSNVGVASPSVGPIYVDSVVVRPVVGTTELADLGVVNAKIANLAVTDAKVGSMSAGKITAGTLSADVVVGARIKTADTGQRVELNALGLKAYNSSNALTVDIPTTGSPSFAGTITATSGAITGNLTVTGTLATSFNTHAKRVVIDINGVHGFGWYKVRGYTDIVLTNGSPDITSASGGFSAADVGRTVVVYQPANGTVADNTAFSGGNSQAVITAFVNANKVTMSLAAAINRTGTIAAPWDAREMTTISSTDGSITSSSIRTATGGKYIALGVDSAAGDNQTFSFMGNVHNGNAMISNPSIYINTDGATNPSDVMCIWHGSQTVSTDFNGLAFHPNAGTQVLDEISLWDAGTHPGRLWTRPGAISFITDQGIAMTHMYHNVITNLSVPGNPTAITNYGSQSVSYPYTMSNRPSVLLTPSKGDDTQHTDTIFSASNSTASGFKMYWHCPWSTVTGAYNVDVSILAVAS